MVAGCIELAGAFGGITSPPNRNNAKGMYENIYIRNNVVKPYLRSICVDAKCQFPLPDVDNTPLPAGFKDNIEINMIREGYDGNGEWYYKGAKMCLMWKMWKEAFSNAKWLIVRRNTEDIVTSCMKTGFMTAFQKSHIQRQVGVVSEEAGWRWWVAQHLRQFDTMLSDVEMDVRMIYPERMLLGDYSELYKTLTWLGLEWNPEIVTFIEPKLWKSKRKENR
jgi:hypothetical protein